MELGFEIFTPFFSEIAVSEGIEDGRGEDDKLPLDELIERLKPFVPEIKYGISTKPPG